MDQREKAKKYFMMNENKNTTYQNLGVQQPL